MIVKQNWSGGKDSTAAAILHYFNGDHVKAVIYIPFFVDKIPLISKQHFDFIQSAKIKLETKFDTEVAIVTGISYYDFCLSVRARGKRKGIPFGFPSYVSKYCYFRNYSKIKALENAAIGYYDYEDIGIAADETKRLSQLNNTKRSILYEHGITEKTAFEICKEYGLLSPNYESEERDGCVLCPNAPRKRVENWLRDFPQAREKLIELQNRVREFDTHTPRRDGYFIKE